MSATDDAASAVSRQPASEPASVTLPPTGGLTDAMPSGISAIAPPLPLSSRLLAKPFVDPICLRLFRWILPASHGWATAAATNGDVEAFAAALRQRPPVASFVKVLKRTAALDRAANEAYDRWRDAAFGETPMPAERLSELEVLRRRAAQRFSADRRSYVLFGRRRRLPAVPYQVPEPDAAISPFQRDPARIEQLFAAPQTMPKIAVSQRGLVRGIVEYWLRFESPARPEVIGDGGKTVWVHVFEPVNPGPQTPTLIWSHGLAMELEMMEAGPLDFLSLARAGIRVLLPDGPGHNRRVTPGLYGGEAFLRAAPISGLHHFSQAASEFAALIDWCRGQGHGRVALGGISLGALSAQVAASHMAGWPAQCRPDALLLLTTTDQVSALVTESALGQVADVDRAVLAAGWKPGHLGTLAAITDAKPVAPIDPDRIVLLLGRRDNVTPYAGGLRLAQQWQLPAANVFVRDQGHFSAAFGLAIDPAPYRRIIEILKG